MVALAEDPSHLTGSIDGALIDAIVFVTTSSSPQFDLLSWDSPSEQNPS